MNLKEFAALKVGDAIANPMSGSVGTVTKIRHDGVDVVWGARHDAEKSFFYAVQSTAWMGWTKRDEKEETPFEDGKSYGQ